LGVLAACAAFIAWSSWLLWLAHLLHSHVDANAELLKNVVSLQAIIHKTEEIPAPPAGWVPIETEYRHVRENMARGDGNYELIQNLIGEVDRAMAGIASIQARPQRQDAGPEAILERQHALEGHTRTALAAIREALARLRNDQASTSKSLEIKWDQMEVLVLGSCALAALLAFVVTERRRRKRLELELRKLSSAIEQCPVTVVITDLEGRIEYANPKFTELTGYALEEVRGEDFRILKSGDTSEEEYRNLWETIRTSEWHGCFHNRKKNGDLFWEAARICPIRDSRGKPTHYLAVKEDITERRRIEEALAQAKESAEAANRVKSEFLANMSHEIRTPLNGIIGFTQLTLQTPLPPDQRDYLETVESSAQALLRIINDILDFSKIEAGHLELEREPFSLRETVAGAANTVAPEAMSKSLDLSWDIDPDVPDALLGDSTRLGQVLLNLLGNAAKFTSRGSIRVGVHRESADESGTEIHFTVRDSGIGIPPAHQRLIFEPFRQGDGSITRKYGGTGLGLAISARLVQSMRGKIWMESEVAHGSVFHFTAWFGGVKTPQAAVEVPAPRGDPNRPSLAILVVEDDPISRTLASTVLTQNGYSVAIAANGVEALGLVERHAFDVILMDIQMPQMDGIEATDRIRRRESHKGGGVRIVAMTAHAMKGDRERCLAAGMDDYISKPLDMNQLLAVVGKIACSRNSA
jgi:PAS domain S-box-containing protein